MTIFYPMIADTWGEEEIEAIEEEYWRGNE